MKNLISLLFLFVNVPLFSQVFITVDVDTQEFLESVDYSLFKNKQSIYKGVTFNDKATQIDVAKDYDSIAFSKADYESRGFAKNKVDSIIWLTKKVIHLDELVIGQGEKEEIVLGETNRFVKRRARPLSKDLDYGSIFTSNSKGKLKLNNIVFYLNKVVFKTAYKIHVLDVDEVTLGQGHQIAEPGNLIYSSDVLYLLPKEKKAEVSFLQYGVYLIRHKPVFIWIQLLGYYDEEGEEFTPDKKDITKLKFQISNEVNYYSRWFDVATNKLSPQLINDNLRIKHDMINMFFHDPHKSDLVTPGVLLYLSKVAE